MILAVGLVVLDQRQLFYGTEARVYMQQQLLGLIGWLAVWWLCEVGEAKPRRLQAAAAVWLSSSAAVCLLHLASIAVVFCQCGVLLALGLWARRDSRLSKLPMAVRFMVLFFPGVVAALALTSDWWLWNSDPWESSCSSDRLISCHLAWAFLTASRVLSCPPWSSRICRWASRRSSD